MINILYGKDIKLINDYIQTQIKKYNLLSLSSYDKESQISDILEDMMYTDIFMQNKCIIIRDADNFIYNEEFDNDIKKTIKNISETTYIFFVLISDTIEVKRIGKCLFNKSKLLSISEVSKYKLDDFIRSSFEKDDYQIMNDALNYFASMYSNDTKLVHNEIQKLKLYKIDDKTISLNDVKKVVSPVLSSDVFALVNACIDKNYDIIFKIYDDLINNNNDIFNILGLLASQFRLFLQIKLLSMNNENIKNIISLTSGNEYNVKNLYAQKDKMNASDIENVLLNIYNTEKNIKCGIINEKEMANMFFLTI